MKNGIKFWISETAILYTVMLFSINLVYVFTDSDPNFSSVRALLLLPAAMMIAAATVVRTSPKTTGIVRWVLHCVLCVLSSYLFIILPAVSDRTGAEKLVGIIAVISAYLVAVLIIGLTLKKVRTAVEADKKYKNKLK